MVNLVVKENKIKVESNCYVQLTVVSFFLRGC